MCLIELDPIDYAMMDPSDQTTWKPTVASESHQFQPTLIGGCNREIRIPRLLVCNPFIRREQMRHKFSPIGEKVVIQGFFSGDNQRRIVVPLIQAVYNP